MAITFEEGVQSIAPSAECLSYPWVEGKSGLVGIIDEVKEDNFGPGTVSISDGINVLNNVDAELEATNYFYVEFPEKKTLMTEILDLMNTFKSQKTQLDSSILGTAIDQYNNNLELAQQTYYNAYLRDRCRIYNNSGDKRLKKKIRVENIETHESREIKLGDWAGDEWIETGNTKTEKERYLNDTITYDTIPNDVMKLTGSSIDEVINANQILMKELSKRGLSYETLPERPAGTS